MRPVAQLRVVVEQVQPLVTSQEQLVVSLDVVLAHRRESIASQSVVAPAIAPQPVVGSQCEAHVL